MELSLVSRTKAEVRNSTCDYFNVTQDDPAMENQLCNRYPDTEDSCPVKWCDAVCGVWCVVCGVSCMW